MTSGPVDFVIIMLPSKHGTPKPTQFDGLECNSSGGSPLKAGSGGGFWQPPLPAAPCASTTPPMWAISAEAETCCAEAHVLLAFAAFGAEVAFAAIGLSMNMDSAVTPATARTRLRPLRNL